LDISSKLKSPSWEHLFGTDHFGRDTFSMVMVGAQTSISVAFIAVGIGMGLGVPLGLSAAAYRGGLLDEFIMRGNDLIFAFPSLLIAIMITAVFGPSAVNAIIAIGIFNIPVFARLSRGAALPLWTRDFILSARVAGKGSARISVEHILPNITNLLVVQGTIQFSLGILAEAGLSYVGLGVQPPIPSWGRMLAESQTLISIAPHLALFPGFAILLTVLGLNLAGDGLRDLLDPRIRRTRR
jgi:peptide/nickel transport system permease protein